MTGAPGEGGTIFMFERKTLWLSDMRGKTNWLRIWGIITGAEVLGELGHFLKHSSVPKLTSVKTNNITMPGKVGLNISHTYQSYQLWKQVTCPQHEKTMQPLRWQGRNNFLLLHHQGLNMVICRCSVTCLLLYLTAWSDMGQVPNKTDGKSCLSAVSPWPNLEKLCWAEQSADLGWAGLEVEDWRGEIRGP